MVLSAEVISTFLEPLVQLGFAGFSVALLWIIVWMHKENRKERRDANEDRKQDRDSLVKILLETNKTIAGNSEIISAVGTQVGESQKMLQTLNDRMLARPCIAKHLNV